MEEYLDKHGDDYTEKQKENMRQKDAIARKEYEAKLAKAYYTSPRFAKDMSFAAGKVGVKMGARQALGFIFAEMWFTVKEEFQTLKGEFQFGEFLETLGLLQEHYPVLLQRFAIYFLQHQRMWCVLSVSLLLH